MIGYYFFQRGRMSSIVSFCDNVCKANKWIYMSGNESGVNWKGTHTWLAEPVWKFEFQTTEICIFLFVVLVMLLLSGMFECLLSFFGSPTVNLYWLFRQITYLINLRCSCRINKVFLVFNLQRGIILNIFFLLGVTGDFLNLLFEQFL